MTQKLTRNAWKLRGWTGHIPHPGVTLSALRAPQHVEHVTAETRFASFKKIRHGEITACVQKLCIELIFPPFLHHNFEHWGSNTQQHADAAERDQLSPTSRCGHMLRLD